MRQNRNISSFHQILVFFVLLFSDNGGKIIFFQSPSRCYLAEAANWAQVVGEQRQNIVTPARAGFSPRWGHASVRTDTSVGVEVIESMIILGGDTVESGSQNQEIVSHKIVGVHHDGSHGFRNDIHTAASYSWSRYRDKVEKTEYNVPMPKIEGVMEWTEVTSGEKPPSDVTYNEWLKCDYDAWEAEKEGASFVTPTEYDCSDLTTAPGSYLADSMWSPRRAHAAINDGNNVIYLMGGRAREHKRLEEERAVGGIKTRPMENDKFHSAWREASVLKNDVWSSSDEGVTWDLVNPGCVVPQEDLIIAGQPYVATTIENNVNKHFIEDLPRYGAKEDKCESDSDCWGDATCQTLGRDSTCVCNMWSPREHHAVVAHKWTDGWVSGDDTGDPVLYVMGGFASKRQRNCGDYACGDIDAASYRQYMNDVWKSENSGLSWTKLTLNATWDPRGGHSIISFLGNIYLFNGQGGTVGQHPKDEVTYYNEIWQLPSEDMNAWTRELSDFTPSGNGTEAPWDARFGHTTVVEEPNAANSEISRLYMIGGRNADGFLSDSWVWRGPGFDWIKDYSGGTSQEYYLDMDSELKELKNVIPNNNKYGQSEIRRENFTTAEDLKLMNSLGLYTVGDLASADRRTILKLRGFDLPQVPEDQRLEWSEEQGGSDGVCYMYMVAKQLMDKCAEINYQLSEMDGEKQLPRNQRPKFKGGPSSDMGVISEWHGIDWGNLGDGSYEAETLEDMIEEWDGCSPLPHTAITWPEVDVSTIGNVPQVSFWRYDVRQQVGEIVCKSNPFPRGFHTSVYFSQQIWLIGGKRSVFDSNNDIWYRDNVMPVSTLNTVPTSGTEERIFEFKSNKEGAIFRYRVYSGDKLKEIRPWTLAYSKENIGWLKNYNDINEKSNKHTQKGPKQDLNEGPGEGNYIFYMRGLDPAGNEDLIYVEGRNMHTWRYSPDPPAGLIVLIFCVLLVCACYVGYEYHKYARAMALERYAIKRIRRKFKGMMADGGDRDAKSMHKKAQKGKKKSKKKKKKKKDKKKGKDGKRAKSGGGKKSGKKNKKKDKKKGKDDKKKKKKKKAKSDTGKKDEKKKKKKVNSEDAKKQRTKGEGRKSKDKPKEKEKKKAKDKDKNKKTKTDKEKKKAIEKMKKEKRKKQRGTSPERKKKQ